MNMKQKKASSLVITFYVISVLLLLVFIFMTWLVYDSIKMTMDQYSMSFGDLWGEMWQSIVNMFASQSFPWLVYAIITYGIGCILNKMDGNALPVASESQADDVVPAQEREASEKEESDHDAASELPTQTAEENTPETVEEKETEKQESETVATSKPRAKSTKKSTATAKSEKTAKKKSSDDAVSKSSTKSKKANKEAAKEETETTPAVSDEKESTKTDGQADQTPAASSDTSEEMKKDE